MNSLHLEPVAAIACLLCFSLPAFPAESIEGQVVHAVTGNALKRVTLTLSRMNSKDKPATTQVDDNGHFVFRDLAPGSYHLTGERTGFERQTYGARSNPYAGAVLAIKDGAPITGLIFKLIPNAILSGRVLDADGEPLPNVYVRTMRREFRNGKRDWQQASGGQTNDRGEYRLSGLRAGRYIINATDFNFGLSMLSSSKGPLPTTPDRTNAPTYFPGTTEVDRAEPLQLAIGEDRRGVDIQIMKTSALRIRGRVSGAGAGKMMMVMLVPKGPSQSFGFGAGAALVQSGESTFEIKGVIPGSYLVVARSIDGFAVAGSPVPVDVTDHHIEGVEVSLSEGGEVAGVVSLAGGVKDVTVRLDIPEAPSMGDGSATSNDSGAFTIKNLFPVKYRLQVDKLPEGAYLKSVKLGGQVVDPESVEIAPASGAKLEILLSKAAAQVKGVVLGPGEKPVSGATVALIPASGRASLYRAATSDCDGAFTLKDITPGDYKLLAWEDLEQGAYQDPEVVKPLESHAEHVTLTENARAEVTLKAIPIAKE